MRAYALIRMTGGAPTLGDLTLRGCCLGASRQDWGMYMIAGTVAQLQAVNALPLSDFVGICTVAEVGEVVAPTVRANINAWADAEFPSLPTLPVGWTNEQVIRELYKRANDHYDHDSFGLAAEDGED